MRADQFLEAATLEYPKESEEWVPVGDGQRRLPPRFTVKTRADRTGGLVWELLFMVVDGTPQCRGVMVSSIEAGREVRSGDLRSAPVEDILELVSSQVAAEIKPDDEGNLTVSRRVFSGDWRREGVAAVRQARRTRVITDDLLREVAEVYRANLDANPTQAVAEHFGKAHRTAGSWVQRAREAGHLGQTTKGKAGEQ